MPQHSVGKSLNYADIPTQVYTCDLHDHCTCIIILCIKCYIAESKFLSVYIYIGDVVAIRLATLWRQLGVMCQWIGTGLPTQPHPLNSHHQLLLLRAFIYDYYCSVLLYLLCCHSNDGATPLAPPTTHPQPAITPQV